MYFKNNVVSIETVEKNRKLVPKCQNFISFKDHQEQRGSKQIFSRLIHCHWNLSRIERKNVYEQHSRNTWPVSPGFRVILPTTPVSPSVRSVEHSVTAFIAPGMPAGLYGPALMERPCNLNVTSLRRNGCVSNTS